MKRRVSCWNERGVSLLALTTAMAITLIGMAAVMPTWQYVMRNEREEELLFRGTQIAEAIIAYRARNNGAGPPTLEALVKGRPRYLRKVYKDPMTASGEWRVIRGEPCPAPTPSANPQSTSLRPIVSSTGSTGGTAFGPITGVVSRSTEKSLRVVWGQSHYNEWCFIAVPKRYPPAIGKQRPILVPGGGLNTPTPDSR